LLAFDDELKRSNGDDLSKLLLPQPASASAKPVRASAPAPLRAVR